MYKMGQLFKKIFEFGMQITHAPYEKNLLRIVCNASKSMYSCHYIAFISSYLFPLSRREGDYNLPDYINRHNQLRNANRGKVANVATIFWWPNHLHPHSVIKQGF